MCSTTDLLNTIGTRWLLSLASGSGSNTNGGTTLVYGTESSELESDFNIAPGVSSITQEEL